MSEPIVESFLDRVGILGYVGIRNRIHERSTNASL